ncbi:MAG: shikimate kinase [Candidatus Cryptobacteroides sp.]
MTNRTSSEYSGKSLKSKAMTISLTGFMGCGKSSIGRLFCERTGSRFIDLDDWIEDRQERKIKDIFAEDGEPEFRRMEVSALKEILENGESQPETEGFTVLSLGGGTLTTPEAVSIVCSNTFCIYLRACTDTLVENLYTYPGERPMLGDSQTDRNALRRKIESLMSVRSSIYESTAHAIIDIDGKDYNSVADEILRIVG